MKDRTKICGECDGVIPWVASLCPYCGSECKHRPEAPPREELGKSLASLYRPPYHAPASVGIAPDALDPFIEFREEGSSVEAGTASVEKQSAPSWVSPFVPFVLLVVAVQWLLFAFFYLIFGHEGKLVLVWDVSSLKLFSLFGVIALIAGLRFFRRLEDS